MAKKTPVQIAPSRQLSGSEASVLKRLAKGEAPVGAIVEGLGSEGYRTDESVRALLALQRNKMVTVQEAKPYATLGSYAWSPLSLWFWAALVAVVASLALISVTSGVGIYLRSAFGGILVLFLPGYALVEALYPKRELDELTTFALSIGLSLALVAITGLLLNYTPLGIKLVPIAISLAGFTLVLLLVALTRKHTYYKLKREVV